MSTGSNKDDRDDMTDRDDVEETTTGDQASDQNEDQHEDTHDDDHEEELGEKGQSALRKERQMRKDAERERNQLRRQIQALTAPSKKDGASSTKDDDDGGDDGNDLRSEIDNLRSQLAKRDRDDMLSRVAREHGIPDEFRDRLVGETEDELSDDAKKIAGLLRVGKIDTDAGERTPTSVRKKDTQALSDPARWGLKR